jgi:flagellar motor protein MotB
MIVAVLAVGPAWAGAADLQFEGAERVAHATETYAELAWPARAARDTWPTISGTLSLAFHRLPAGTAPAEAYRDVEQALAAAGYRIVDRCALDACYRDERFDRAFDALLGSRPMQASPGWPTSAGALAYGSEPHMLRAERAGPPREHLIVQVYVARRDYAVASARGQTMIATVGLAERAPTLGRVQVRTAEDLGRALARDGRLALYGIYFDTDSAVVKPESQPQVAEIVKYLQGDPKASIFVVGHTDMSGALERNLDLSKRRAESVVAALTAAGIPATRVTARGVGPLAPVASNADEAGRALNRRVEVVAR